MTKTLSCSFQDVEKQEWITISGTLHDGKFNEAVILTLGQNKVSVNSQEIAEVLAEVVKFQTPSEKNDV